MGKITFENYKFDGTLTKEVFDFWGYKPGVRDEQFQKEIHISNKIIRKIDPNLFNGFTKLTILDLSNNQLTQLSDQQFGGLINLKKLYLNNNKIEILGFGWDNRKLFEGLNKLEVLHLNKNKIQSLPEYVFKDLANLFELNLESNYIKSIHYESLSGLINLKVLNLRWNCISFISADALQGTKILGLDQNKIDYIFGWNKIIPKLMPNGHICF